MIPNGTGSANDRVNTTVETNELQEYLKQGIGAMLTEFSDEFGLGKNTVHHHGSTLAGIEYSIKTDGEYQSRIGDLAVERTGAT